MSDEFKDMLEEDYEEFETIVLTDEDSGEEIEFIIIDKLETEGCNYLLVIESEEFDVEVPDASIIKETIDESGEAVYEAIDDDDEFDRVAELFKNNEEYELN